MADPPHPAINDPASNYAFMNPYVPGSEFQCGDLVTRSHEWNIGDDDGGNVISIYIYIYMTHYTKLIYKT